MAQDNGPNTAELQKQIQNPVANLISVPFQNNTNFPVGKYARVQDVLNIQPIVPLHLNEDWNLITRWITPVVYQPNVGSGEGGANGLGDLNPSFFFSPAKVHKMIWGFGPTLVPPTATERTLAGRGKRGRVGKTGTGFEIPHREASENRVPLLSEFRRLYPLFQRAYFYHGLLGQGKRSAGPSAVVLVQPESWTIGVLANNVWSFAGNRQLPAVNQSLVQYFINYNMKDGWYTGSQPILTSNWKANGSKITRVSRLPINAQLGAYYNLVYPRDLPYGKWQVRLQIAMLFPKAT